MVGVFRLTERKNAPAPCGQGVGAEASVAFQIADGHITTWLRVADPAQADPLATATPSATDPTATATPSATPTPAETADPTIT